MGARKVELGSQKHDKGSQKVEFVEIADDEAIRQRIDKRQRALIENDRATMDSLLHPHYFYVNDAGQSYDKQAFLDNLFNQGAHQIHRWPRMFSLEIEEAVATVGYEVEGNFLIGGRRHDGLYHIYHTLIKLDGLWVFIAGHIALAPVKHEADD